MKKNPTESPLTISQVINKWKLHKGLLASKLEMKLPNSCNKLNEKHTTQFSDSEMVKLKIILRELYNDVDWVTDIEFEEALKTMIGN